MTHPPARVRDSEATRESLHLAGLEEFAARGFDGATVDRIAARAGVNKAMINYHFAGKAGLYRAILASEFSWLQERLVDLEASPADPGARLARFIAVFGELHTRHPHLSRMLMREVMSGGLHLDDDLLSRIRAVFGTVQAIVEAGVREGTFRPVHPLLTHLTVVGSLVFFFASTPLRERIAASGWLPVSMPGGDDFVRNLQSLVTRGLAPSKET